MCLVAYMCSYPCIHINIKQIHIKNFILYLLNEIKYMIRNRELKTIKR